MPNSQDKNLFKLFFLIINIYFEYLLPIRLFIYTINSIFTKLITSFSSLLSPKILHLVFIDKVFVTTMVNSIFFTKLIISFPSLFIWIRFRVTFIPSHHNRQKLDEEWRRKERKKKKGSLNNWDWTSRALVALWWRLRARKYFSFFKCHIA